MKLESMYEKRFLWIVKKKKSMSIFVVGAGWCAR